MAPPSPDDYARYAAAVEKTDGAAEEERTCAEKIGLSYTSRSSIILNAEAIRLALRGAVDKKKYKTQDKVRYRAKYLYNRLLESLYPG